MFMRCSSPTYRFNKRRNCHHKRNTLWSGFFNAKINSGDKCSQVFFLFRIRFLPRRLRHLSCSYRKHLCDCIEQHGSGIFSITNESSSSGCVNWRLRKISEWLSVSRNTPWCTANLFTDNLFSKLIASIEFSSLNLRISSGQLIRARLAKRVADAAIFFFSSLPSCRRAEVSSQISHNRS